MMRYFLESEGHTVVTAGDGPSALAAVEEFGRTRPSWTLECLDCLLGLLSLKDQRVPTR